MTGSVATCGAAVPVALPVPGVLPLLAGVEAAGFAGVDFAGVCAGLDLYVDCCNVVGNVVDGFGWGRGGAGAGVVFDGG